MPWTVTTTSAYVKQRSKANLTNSEENKLQRWLDDIPNHGPYTAAHNQSVEIKKLNDADQYQIDIGKVNRVSFTIDTKEQSVELIALGHT